jgi:hypothetical protein
MNCDNFRPGALVGARLFAGEAFLKICTKNPRLPWRMGCIKSGVVTEDVNKANADRTMNETAKSPPKFKVAVMQPCPIVLDRAQIVGGRFDFDVVRHCALPDIFERRADDRAKRPVAPVSMDAPAGAVPANEKPVRTTFSTAKK